MHNNTNSASFIPRVWQVLVTVFFVLALIALFIPGIDYSDMTGDWPPRFRHWVYSFHDGNATETIIPTLVTVLAMCGGIVTIWKNKSNAALGCACVYAIDEIIYIVSVIKQSNYHMYTDPAAGFFVFSAFVVALFVFCIMAKKKTQQGVRPTKTANAQVMQNAEEKTVDELIKYKSLLDSGVITQEEYDTKKKQLLNL